MKWPSWFPVSQHDRLSIVGVGFWYATITKRAAEDTGRQNDRLISAANTQADAAKRMADASSAQALKMTELAQQTAQQASFTNLLAQQTKRYADIASDALKANQELSREDRRAWVSAEIGGTGGNSGRFFIAMHNTGKTPALNVTYVAAFSPGKLGVIPEVDLSTNSSTPILTKNLPPDLVERLKKEGTIPNHPLTGFVIAPGKSEIESYFGSEFGRIFGFPPDTRMYIQGRFTYDDIFGQHHETRFCYWYASADEFPMCSDHNFMN